MFPWPNNHWFTYKPDRKSGSEVYIEPGVQMYDATIPSIIYGNIMLFNICYLWNYGTIIEIMLFSETANFYLELCF